ncbi:MAG: hypothetical protein WC655_05545 [Candidatus Hydrogenedentales bacterium]|jgi:hypothetical protein
MKTARNGSGGFVGSAIALSFGLLLAGFVFSGTASALLYRTPEGTLKDNCVVWDDGVYHLFTMYRRVPKDRDQDQWRGVWSATSTDGVHWKDVGPVINDAPFGIYAMRVWKAGDKFLMNHGSFTGEAQDVLKLWESSDLEHWTYLGPEFDIRRPDGQRIDHMDVVTEVEAGKTVYYGYAVGGMLRSEDSYKWTWLGDVPLTDKLDIRVVQEPGGCQRIGDLFYLLVGGFFPGNYEYAVGTYISEEPTGPFRPDYPALRLNGYSGRNLVALWAGYCRKPDELLLTNYILDPVGDFWWHAPLKTAVIDDAKHLRMGYWKGNEALKGAELPCDLARAQSALPDSGNAVNATSDALTFVAAPRPQSKWITPGDPNWSLAFLETPLKADKGLVIEGTIKVTRLNDIFIPTIGICLERPNQEATAILFETWGQTEIGTLRWSGAVHFDSEDKTGFGCATVAGITPDKTCRFRILYRQNIFECYLDDLLVQTYSIKDFTGRIGFVVQDGEGTFGDLKAWEMSLP